MLTTNPNPLASLNNQRKFLFAKTDATPESFYIRIITKPEDMQARHDCSELLRKMLNTLECKDKPLAPEWAKGYEGRIVSNNRCEKDNYTYFILENEAGDAIGILSGDIYPNNDPDAPEQDGKSAINMKNLFVDDKYRNTGFAQMLLSKILTVIPKMTGEITMVMKELGKESRDLGNLERYTGYATKAELTSISKDNPNEPDGIFFMVKNNLPYDKAKSIAKSFRQNVATGHALDITKTPERKGWRSTP
ncbi:MAG: GNAT family N-acetyltransferase [Gammaproteobacteria bacterium]